LSVLWARMSNGKICCISAIVFWSSAAFNSIRLLRYSAKRTASWKKISMVRSAYRTQHGLTWPGSSGSWAVLRSIWNGPGRISDGQLLLVDFRYRDQVVGKVIETGGFAPNLYISRIQLINH
jgi:hypothetical protein